MKLSIQVQAEMSHSASEGQASTPLSTPESMPTPTGGPPSGNLFQGTSVQKRTSHQGSVMPSTLKSSSFGNRGLESPTMSVGGQSSSLNGLQFGSVKPTALASSSSSRQFNLSSALDKGLAHVDESVNQEHNSAPLFAPLRRRSSLPGIPRSSSHSVTPISAQVAQRMASNQGVVEASPPTILPEEGGSKSERASWPRHPVLNSATAPTSATSVSMSPRIPHQEQFNLPSLSPSMSRQASQGQSLSSHPSKQSPTQASLLNRGSSLSLDAPLEGEASPGGTLYKGHKSSNIK